MSKKEDYELKTEEFVTPILERLGFELYDIDYVKEGGEYFLRVYIDKDGGVTIDDCIEVSREMNEILDREDYIADAYTFEVSSPGLMRPLKKEKDFARALAKESVVEVHTYQAINGRKEFIGRLVAYDDATVTLSVDDETQTFERKSISLIRLYDI